MGRDIVTGQRPAEESRFATSFMLGSFSSAQASQAGGVDEHALHCPYGDLPCSAAGSVEDGRGHQRAVFAERVGRVPSAAAAWLSV